MVTYAQHRLMAEKDAELASDGDFQLFSGAKRRRRQVPAVSDAAKPATANNLEETSDVARADPQGDHDELPDGDFKSLGLSDWLDRTLTSLGITAATPVQKSCIPPILKVTLLRQNPSRIWELAALCSCPLPLPVTECMPADHRVGT